MKNKNNKPHVIIIGAGPAGLGAAFKVTRKNHAHVTVIEQGENVGGIAGSFEISGVHVDYGSHRLHPSCDPEIMNDIKTLLNDDLLNRPRHGRIRLFGKWIHFPLKPLDLMFRLSPIFSGGVMIDIIAKTLGTGKNSLSNNDETFASVLEAGLGRTVCKNFYFPYSKKLWGLPPEELSAVLAHRRVSANSLKKMFLKILTVLPFVKKNDAGRFYYPKKGFGQISECLYNAAIQAGAQFYLNSRLKTIEINGKSVKSVCFDQKGQMIKRKADFVWSTIPLPDLVKCMEPSPPDMVTRSLDGIKYRSMILIYLLLEQNRFSEYDAHYFPELHIPISRLSETKNYYNSREPEKYTVLCAELPCSKRDPKWNMTDEELGKIVCQCLESAGIPVKVPIKHVTTRRLKHAYPIYYSGYEKYFHRIDEWLEQIENLISFGRQGLFVHDNTHHALYMAYSAAKCLGGNGDFDMAQWQRFKQIFDSFVVED